MLTTHKVRISAIHTVVPKTTERTIDLPFDRNHLERVCEASGITQRHVAHTCTSYDLALSAASSILDTGIDRQSIGAIVYVTQTPSSTIPSEAHRLQHDLGLSQSIQALTVTEGCAGYLYGLQVAASLVSCSRLSVLLVVADTISQIVDPDDSGTRPLFGDGAAATLLEYNDDKLLTIETGSDGSGSRHICVDQDKLTMDGMEVFMFGIRKVPKLIKAFLATVNATVQDFDYLVLHQANQLMIDRIGKKLGFDPEQVVKALSQFGNTSAASIPLAMTTTTGLTADKQSRLLFCGFGAGLAWGMVDCIIDKGVALKHSVMHES